jgi:shikimate kinase
VRDALERIELVGLPRAGKSTLGALVASALGWDFVDLEAEIVSVAGIGLPDLFRR